MATCDQHDVAFHRHRARAILKKAYPVTYYSTHRVASDSEIRAYKAHKACLSDRKQRRKLGAQRHELASAQRQRIAETPFTGGDGHYWAIPWSSVYCESGGSYTIGYAGAYGMTAPAWNESGGSAVYATARDAPPWAQDHYAAIEYARHGDSAWVPFEGGCA